MCGSRAAVPALCFEQVVGRCHFDPEMDGSPPSFLAISRSKWHFRVLFLWPVDHFWVEVASTRQIPKTRERATRDSFVRQSGVAAEGAIASGMSWSRSRLPPLANSGIAADSSPEPREQGLPADGANRARTARRRKCLVTSRGARNIFSPLVDDLTVCDPLCSFCGDRTDNLTPACKRDETPIRRCTHGKSGNDVRL